jgi:hypothetical protein
VIVGEVRQIADWVLKPIVSNQSDLKGPMTQQLARGPTWAAEAALAGTLHPEMRLSPPEFAAALSALGFPTSAKTLATRRTRGGSAPFEKFGKYVTYAWGPGLNWARSRLSAPMCSTSEIAAQRAATATPAITT